MARLAICLVVSVLTFFNLGLSTTLAAEVSLFGPELFAQEPGTRSRFVKKTFNAPQAGSGYLYITQELPRGLNPWTLPGASYFDFYLNHQRIAKGSEFYRKLGLIKLPVQFKEGENTLGVFTLRSPGGLIIQAVVPDATPVEHVSVFGPETFERLDWRTKKFSKTFNVDEARSGIISVSSGSGNRSYPSRTIILRAAVLVNNILAASYRRGQTGSFQLPVRLNAGSNEVTVHLLGRLGESYDVELLATNAFHVATFTATPESG
jgi:hypothetical protein